MDNWKLYYTLFDRDFDSMRQAVENVKAAHDSIVSREDFWRQLKQLIGGLWRGDISQAEFAKAMYYLVDAALRSAWNRGFLDHGITPSEQTDFEEEQRDSDILRDLQERERERSERQRIFNIVLAQLVYIAPLAAFILARKKASDEQREEMNLPLRKTPTEEVKQRARLWVNKYDDVYEEAKVTASRDKKLKWVLGIAEHCSSCLKLHGIVKRASFWQQSGVLPRKQGAEYLECRGYQCKCQLVPTSEPITQGRLPVLP